jgi:uncharacterized membrane protein YraQ (UPF0718 family)
MVVRPSTTPRDGIMALLLNPSAVRALILAVILACVAAVTAPMARGSTMPSAELQVLNEPQLNRQHSALGTQHLVLADEWSWHEFVKFWERQLGSMSGVVGTVLLVGAGAVLLILYKGKG